MSNEGVLPTVEPNTGSTSSTLEREKTIVPGAGILQSVANRVAGLPDHARNELIAMISEFVGTFLFLFFAFATAQAANSDPYLTTTGSNPGQLVMISLGFGFSLAANVCTFFRVSGGLVNPAVSLPSPLSGPLLRSVLPCCSDVSRTRGLFIEMFLTAQLCITILMLAAEKHRARPLAPLGIGFALFIAHLVGVYFTGAGVNPARSFGPCVAIPSFPNYHWIYWLGPMLGAVLAAGLYKVLKFLQYETANPGQDDDGFGVLVTYFEDEKLGTKVRGGHLEP
ncbi:aquaporin-like protein [Lipomyces tetrasporus]